MYYILFFRKINIFEWKTLLFSVLHYTRIGEHERVAANAQDRTIERHLLQHRPADVRSLRDNRAGQLRFRQDPCHPEGFLCNRIACSDTDNMVESFLWLGVLKKRIEVDATINSIVANELKRINRREEDLRRQAHKETPKWKTELKEKVPEKVYASLRIVFRKAFEIIFEKGTGIIEKTYKKDELSKDYQMRDFSIALNSRKDYFWLNARSDLNSLTTLLASAAEGVGLGALGIGMPDIILFTSIVLRGCYETALRYGFTYDTPEEKYFILAILECSLLKGEAWDACNERVNAMIHSPHIPTEAEMKAQMQHTADAFAVDMLVSKFIQGIPVVGVVGGLTNPIYYRKIQFYVRLKYQKRFLMKKSAYCCESAPHKCSFLSTP